MDCVCSLYKFSRFDSQLGKTVFWKITCLAIITLAAYRGQLVPVLWAVQSCCFADDNLTSGTGAAGRCVGARWSHRSSTGWWSSWSSSTPASSPPSTTANRTGSTPSKVPCCKLWPTGLWPNCGKLWPIRLATVGLWPTWLAWHLSSFHVPSCGWLFVRSLDDTSSMLFSSRDREHVLHHCLHPGDVPEDVQPRPSGLLRLAVQPVWFPRRHLQHRGGDLHLHEGASAPRSQRAAVRTLAEGVQGNEVRHLEWGGGVGRWGGEVGRGGGARRCGRDVGWGGGAGMWSGDVGRGAGAGRWGREVGRGGGAGRWGRHVGRDVGRDVGQGCRAGRWCRCGVGDVGWEGGAGRWGRDVEQGCGVGRWGGEVGWGCGAGMWGGEMGRGGGAGIWGGDLGLRREVKMRWDTLSPHRDCVLLLTDTGRRWGTS